MRQYLSFFIPLSFFFFFLMNTDPVTAQPSDPYEKHYDQVRKLLEEEGLPKSALEYFQKNIQSKIKPEDEPQYRLKSDIYALILNTIQAESDTLMIRELLTKARNTQQPVSRAIWSSIAARQLNAYFANHSWEILQRSEILEQDDDFTQWTENKFRQEVTSLYMQSLQPEQELKNIPIQEYASLYQGGKNISQYRLTLYDLLANDALEYFATRHFRSSRAQADYLPQDTLFFLAAPEFLALDIPSYFHKESTDLLVLTTYQDLMRFHYSINNVGYAVYLDLKRLQFVQSKTSQAATAHYIKALEDLTKRYPTVAETDFARVKIYQHQYQDETDLEQQSTVNLPEIAEQLQIILDKSTFQPALELARSLLQSLYATHIHLFIEEVMLPAEHIKMMVSYKNASALHYHIYKINYKDVLRQGGGTTARELYKNGVLVTKQQVDLPASEDMKLHSTEINLGAFDLGMYVLIAGYSEESLHGEEVRAEMFVVSRLAAVEGQIGQYYALTVLDRKNGKPLPDAKVTMLNNEYNRRKRLYEWKVDKQYSLNQDAGLLLNENIQGRQSYLLSLGTDTLLGSLYTSRWNISNQWADTPTRSLIFTDRAVYRPGQKIQVKGIVYQDFSNAKKEVRAGKEVRVALYDVNGQEIPTAVEVRTNEFGSYTAEFTIPEGRLNGTFTIRDNWSNQYIKVEEYKRPQFVVTLENLQDDYRLGKSTTMQGNARTYSGVGVSNAEVRYTVYRSKTMPYWRPYMRIMPSKEELISTGLVQTDAAGNFSVPFILKTDPHDKPEDGIIYTYRVDAEVTDITGEMHSSKKTVTAGFQSFLIRIDAPEMVPAGKEFQIKASITNHNGTALAKSADIKLFKLVYPGTFKARLWSKPSEQQFTKEAHRRLFPHDEYEHESDPKYWERNEVLTQKGIQLEDLSKYLTREVFEQAGYYALEISLPDDQGARVYHQQVFYYHIPGSKLAEAPLLLALDTTRASPGDELSVALLSDHPEQSIYWFEGDFAQEKTSFKNPGSYRLQIKQQERGGKLLGGLIIRNNRVYTRSKNVDIPWTDKQLAVSWAAHRDKLAPGSEEEWTFTIKNHQNKAQESELITVLYDASLDQIAPLNWPGGNLYRSYYSSVPTTRQHFSTRSLYLSESTKKFDYPDSELVFPRLELPGLYYGRYYSRSFESTSGSVDYASAPAPTAMRGVGEFEQQKTEVAENSRDKHDPSEVPTQSDVRTNFSETALFAPLMTTNAQGETEVKFRMPESLTTWNLRGFAHTKDLKTGSVAGSIVTHKDLMVQPNMPRFFRQKDQVVLRARVSNTSEKNLQGTVSLELLDPDTRSSLASGFQLIEASQNFLANAGENTEVKWSFSIPEDLVRPVLVRITAKSEHFSDGEEHLIPVLTNRLYVTEALTLPFIGSAEKTFTLATMQKPSDTRTHAGLTFEFTSNPTWYVVQALPYLIEYPYECTEQIFSKLYANAVSAKIIEKNPSISEVIQQWKKEDGNALQSALQKNESLKTALLQETPWLQDAQNETEQKQRIAHLLDPTQTKKSLQTLSDRLKMLQLEDGAWGWFAGMSYNEYISNYILAGWGKLVKMKAITPEMASLETSMHQAVTYSDHQLVRRFNRLKEQNKNWRSSKYFSEAVVQYLYMRSFYPEVVHTKESKEAYDFFFEKVNEDLGTKPLMLKAQMAIVLHRKNDKKAATKLIQSLYENSVYNPELGRYWPTLRASYYWQEMPIESQATIIEAFAETGHYPEAIEEMKIWLLKQKQTAHWGTTTSTADACYALLATGADWLSQNPEVSVQIGTETFALPEKNAEAGTGYFHKKYEAEEITDQMASVSIAVKQPPTAAKRPSWGAMYWQYFEDADKVEAYSGPIKIERKLYRVSINNEGEILEEIKEHTALRPGDKITVRIMIRSDRNMEFVHLKDQRAAGFEPTDVLSGYSRAGSLWFYRSIGDASVNFFFDHLPQGTHTLEYSLKVNASGTYSHGMATIQCMYAPEFGAHTDGSTLVTIE